MTVFTWTLCPPPSVSRGGRNLDGSAVSLEGALGQRRLRRRGSLRGRRTDASSPPDARRVPPRRRGLPPHGRAGQGPVRRTPHKRRPAQVHCVGDGAPLRRVHQLCTEGSQGGLGLQPPLPGGQTPPGPTSRLLALGPGVAGPARRHQVRELRVLLRLQDFRFSACRRRERPRAPLLRASEGGRRRAPRAEHGYEAVSGEGGEQGRKSPPQPQESEAESVFSEGPRMPKGFTRAHPGTPGAEHRARQASGRKWLLRAGGTQQSAVLRGGSSLTSKEIEPRFPYPVRLARKRNSKIRIFHSLTHSRLPRSL